MNNLGILNNRFYQKAIEQRQRHQSVDILKEEQGKGQKKRNEYYERWLTNQERKKQEQIHSDSNIETITPQTPKAQVPCQLMPKLISGL